MTDKDLPFSLDVRVPLSSQLVKTEAEYLHLSACGLTDNIIPVIVVLVAPVCSYFDKQFWP